MLGFQSTRLATEGALEPFFFLYTDDSIQGNPETCKQSSIMLNYEVKNIQGITCNTYWQQWIICLIGILLVSVGVSLEVKAGVVVLAGEGVVLAVCKVLPKVKFGYMKVGFDVTLVVIACILSIVFTGRLQGVREGTVAAALLVGLIAKQLGKLLARWKLEEV